MSRFQASIVSAILLLVGFATIAHAQTPLTNDQIIKNFNAIAFGNEYTKKQYQTVRKWKDPIYAGIIGNPPDTFDDMISAFLDELIAATGHPIALVHSPRMQREKRRPKLPGKKKIKVNLFLIYDSIQGISAFLKKNKIPHGQLIIDQLSSRKAHCMATINKKNNNIFSAFVYFPAYHTAKNIRICIVEELTQVMGLPNDSREITQSIFKDRGKHNELTPQDRLFLRLLYDDGVKHGMARVEALKAIYANLNRIRPAGIRQPVRTK